MNATGSTGWYPPFAWHAPERPVQVTLTPGRLKRWRASTSDDVPTGDRHSDTRPLVLTTGGRVLLVVFIVLGILGAVGGGVAETRTNQPSSSGYSVRP